MSVSRICVSRFCAGVRPSIPLRCSWRAREASHAVSARLPWVLVGPRVNRVPLLETKLRFPLVPLLSRLLSKTSPHWRSVLQFSEISAVWLHKHSLTSFTHTVWHHGDLMGLKCSRPPPPDMKSKRMLSVVPGLGPRCLSGVVILRAEQRLMRSRRERGLLHLSLSSY